MKVLAVDVGGTHVKVLATGQKTPQKFAGKRVTVTGTLNAAAKTIQVGSIVAAK